jgi:hypothetical protein
MNLQISTSIFGPKWLLLPCSQVRFNNGIEQPSPIEWLVVVEWLGIKVDFVARRLLIAAVGLSDLR